MMGETSRMGTVSVDIGAEVDAIREFDADADARNREFDLDELASNDTAPLWKQIIYPVYWKTDSQNLTRIGNVQVAAIEERGSELDAVIISDYADCDGRGAAGIYHAKFGSDMIYIPASHRGNAFDVLPAVEKVADAIAPDIPIYVSDLAPNEAEQGDYVAAFNALAADNPIHIRDHHEWPDEAQSFIKSISHTFVVDHDRCAAEIVFDCDFTGDDESQAMFERLTELTRIRDLWMDEHPDFDGAGETLVNASFELDYMEYERLVARVGADMMADTELGQRLREHRAEKHARVQIVAKTARWHEFSGYRCAFAYGDCYSSGVGAVLQDRGADIAVIVTPSGKVSIRTTENAPVAEVIASELGGGGHPTAAGCTPLTVGGEDGDVGYLDLWTSRGLPVHLTLAHTIDRLPSSDD